MCREQSDLLRRLLLGGLLALIYKQSRGENRISHCW